MIVLDVQITQQRTWRQNLQQKNVENNWKYYSLFYSFELIDYTDLHDLRMLIIFKQNRVENSHFSGEMFGDANPFFAGV